MIEILVIIAVVKMFSKTAKQKNLNHVLWSVIGALSYYVPVLVMGFLVLPALIESRTFDIGDGIGAILLAVLINVAVGVITCVIAYQVLRSQDAKMDPSGASPFDVDEMNRDL